MQNHQLTLPPPRARARVYSIASFRLKLGPTYTFDFIDGPLPSTPAPGITAFYSGPYYSFYHGSTPTAAAANSTSDLHAAHTFLDSHLLDPVNGKTRYDGVMGFSQGCAVIASYIMYRQNEKQKKDHKKAGGRHDRGAAEELPFKVAVFICGGLPLGVVEDLGGVVGKECWEWDERSRKDLHTMAGGLVDLKPGMDPWALHRHPNGKILGVHQEGRIGAGRSEAATEKVDDDDKNADIRYGLDFSKMPASITIRIPTVHIYGQKDPRAKASLLLSEFCDDDNGRKKIFGHPGGHEIPRHRNVSEEIAELVEWSGVVADMF